MKNIIKVVYPRTEFINFNKEIRKYIDSSLIEFMSYGEVDVQLDLPYDLYIYYEKYSYKNYLSYVFYNSMFTGGAHPNNTIYSITYDKSKGKVITISDLLKDNPNLLKILSSESRLELMNKIDSYIDMDMLNSGTEGNLNNFRNFAFSDKGFVIFFEQYQVAPYLYGSFNVVIPYSKINLKTT